MFKIWITAVFICISLISAAAGLLLFLNPALAIELQRRFYERINWRIEPIDMQKEIRNTRLMGLCLIVICFLIMILWPAGFRPMR